MKRKEIKKEINNNRRRQEENKSFVQHYLGDGMIER